MTGWYPYKWVCTACGAVHYYAAPACSRCGHDDLAPKINSERSVERLPEHKRLAVVADEPKTAAVDESKPTEVSPPPAVPEPRKTKAPAVKPKPAPVAEVDTAEDELDAAMRAFMEDL